MNKFYSMLGLAQKAGLLKSGEMGCIEAMKSKKGDLLILAKDASENTKKRFIKLSKKYGLDIVLFGEKSKLGSSIGKGMISTIVICDYNFSKSIRKLIE